ncbi:hypothetical protein E2562_034687 [Oryza meyeriana var. granulata]|uniref:Uncharacterized protein n=1 Tax=Oryza meyeriana var. granulata TaxID=110450 RepID=A0A6G1C1J9_9ORYZ|nr:hypothetical protein E2562_034687 [Oryza meyeriana var. granulata]
MRWPSRLMVGFRKMLVGLFSFPPRPPTVTFSVDDRYHHHHHRGGGGGGSGDAPKRSCSSNLHPLNAHYDEAIADCVEFFNKSAEPETCRVDVRSRPHAQF